MFAWNELGPKSLALPQAAVERLEQNANSSVLGTPIDGDRDGDRVHDDFDVAPDDPSESIDTDGDLIGDSTDTDDDDDGVPDEEDPFPLHDHLWLDSDNDGLHDQSDSDITGDQSVDWIIQNRARLGLASDLAAVAAYVAHYNGHLENEDALMAFEALMGFEIVEYADIEARCVARGRPFPLLPRRRKWPTTKLIVGHSTKTPVRSSIGWIRTRRTSGARSGG